MSDYERVADALGNTTWITWCTGATLDDVLALYGGGRNLPMTATFRETDEAAYFGLEEGTLFLFAGALGHGVVLMEPGLPCVDDAERIRLSQAGVCLTSAGAYPGSAMITYRDEGQVEVSFDGSLEVRCTPDQETVERWMSTTPGGLERWQTDPARRR